MSHRKTRKQKQLAEKRNRTCNIPIEELEELKAKALELESRIVEQELKATNKKILSLTRTKGDKN